MSILNDQTLYELDVTQTLTNDLADNLTTMGVPSEKKYNLRNEKHRDTKIT